jgi:heat shock protein 4
MSVVGVDFGGQYSVIAAAGRGGVDVLLNGNSQRQNPTMIGFDATAGRVMGEGASSTAMSRYKQTICNMKRMVGLSYNDPRAKEEMKHVAFTCVPLSHHDTTEDSIGVEVPVNAQGDTKVVAIEHVAGMMIQHLGTIAAARSMDKTKDPNTTMESLFPTDWVIGIPGFYTDAQRRSLLAGCEVAGIPRVQRLMHETTATALAFGIFKDIRKEFADQEAPSHVMFIDMGYAAYQVSIVAFAPGKLSVKSYHFDADLGGRDFDAKVGEWIIKQFETKYKNKISAPLRERKKIMLKILAAAEKAKKTLSPFGVQEARINIECLADDLDFSAALKSKDYEKMCEPLLARLGAPIERALAEAKISAKDLASIEIVGGATRVGCLKRHLAGVLGLDVNATNNGLSTTMNADEAVSRGTALQSAILSPRFKVLPYEIVEFQPYAIQISWDGEASSTEEQGVEVEEGAGDGSDGQPTNSVTMFDRGSNFPVVKRVTLKRSGIFAVEAKYKEGASTAPHCGITADIATIKIKAPALVDGGADKKVRVNVKQDVHGSLTLSSAQLIEEVIEEEAPAAEPVAAVEGEKMDVDKKEGEADAPVPKKKNKIKKTNLEFEVTYPLEWTKATKEEAMNLEAKLIVSDKLIKETSDKRNELESYLYDMRDRIIGALRDFAPDDVREVFQKKLEQLENWLYEDGYDADKDVYNDKLSEVKKFGDPIVHRFEESKARAAAVSGLQKRVEDYKQWLATVPGNEKLDHLTLVEVSLCHKKCDKVMAWMYDMLDKQGSLSPEIDPAFTVMDVKAKLKELDDTIGPTVRKPRPAPKPVAPAPAPKAEEKSNGDGDAKKADDDAMKTDEAEKKEGEPMETN